MPKVKEGAASTCSALFVITLHQMMWENFLRRLPHKSERFAPVTHEEIIEAEEILDVALPDELKSLLQISDGLCVPNNSVFLWSLSRIIQTNLDFRHNSDFKELYMPSEPLLFFANDTDGDQFAFTILDGKVRRPDIFVWSHEMDSRIWIAPSLELHLDWWLKDNYE